MSVLDDVTVECILQVVDASSPRGWMILDRNFRIMYMNATLSDLFQLSRTEFEGQSLVDCFYEGKKQTASGRYLDRLVETMDTGREFRDAETYFYVPAKGVCAWYFVSTYLIREETGQAVYVVGTYAVIDALKALEKQLNEINVTIIRAFAKAIGARDAGILYHEEQVAKLMGELAEKMAMEPTAVRLAYLAGILHDVGKIGIPEQILNKTGSLTEKEFTLIKHHSNIGADILAEIDGFGELASIVRHHHERFDGRGYPQGLSGTNIPLLSRMLTLCDSFDAMVSNRRYRKSLSVCQALDEVLRCAGKQFDPAISLVLIDMLRAKYLNER